MSFGLARSPLQKRNWETVSTPHCTDRERERERTNGGSYDLKEARRHFIISQAVQSDNGLFYEGQQRPTSRLDLEVNSFTASLEASFKKSMKKS